MNPQRVICFIDGYNLYHAIHNLKSPHLKWVNYWALSSTLIPPKTHKLIDVFYFSAYAPHFPESRKRHIKFVKALTSYGVKPVMGKFKVKDRRCPECKYKWNGYEEKETDVNIALTMLNLAYQDQYDHAFLISNDSDLAPAISLIRVTFPKKLITTVVPPNKWHSDELIKVSSEKAKIKVAHLERCLLPEVVSDAEGKVIVARPKEYDPPVQIKNGLSPYYQAEKKPVTSL